MSWVTRDIAHCDECGFEWLPKGTPERCASQKCRKRTWNRKQEFQDFVSTTAVTGADARELVPVITAKPQVRQKRVRTAKAPKTKPEPLESPEIDEIEQLMKNSCELGQNCPHELIGIACDRCGRGM